MKYMILGAGGVFGNLTARHLLASGHEVIAIGRSSLKPHFHLGVGSNNPAYQYHQMHLVFEKAAFYDILHKEQPDIIINFAALAYSNSWDNPKLFYNTNMMMIVDLVQFLQKKRWLKRFIQIGSSEVYGSTDQPANENSPLNPTSPYAVSKLAADLHLLTMSGLPVNIIRPSNCYGEGQYTYRIIPKAILYLLAGKVFPLEGGGVAEKSFMHASDLANAIETVSQKGVLGEIYNAGSDNPVSMKEIVATICQQLHKPMNEFTYDAPARAIEDKRYWLNSDKIKALGWQPTVTLSDGIARMIAWCRQYQNELLLEPSVFTLRA